jgi:DNA polymerase-3 subunit epsilon/ATP-dependent DNA helicase DinG
MVQSFTFRADPRSEQVFVALDLETTGLDSSRDTIIEIGAVKFQGDQVIDTFETFINPGRSIPEFVQRLTGISPRQVRRAPFFSTVAADLETFLEHHPIIGHNISFDMQFLESHGLPLENPRHDTWDLASVMLPRTNEYSLSYLTRALEVKHFNPHRALDDAQATRGVFLALLHRAGLLDPSLLHYIAGLAGRSRWSIAPLLAGMEGTPGQSDSPSTFGLTGLDLQHLAARLHRPEHRRSDPDLEHLDAARIVALLGADGPFAGAFPGFERRPQQEEMLEAVTKAIHQQRHLVVEAGTGVGKSMAYLLPAALFAASKGQRVVISTNTINLQEQLIRKDIPALIEVLEGAGLVTEGSIKAALLKGRGNYLCLRRWNYLARSENPTVEDARLLSKTAVWLQDTATGDRGEINLSGRDAFTWNRVSASEKSRCTGLRDGGPCFLRAARDRAEEAHIIVVNHALLLADIAHGGSLIPDYHHLIVDEAHNLEEEATSQLSYEISGERLPDILDTQGRLTTELRLALRTEGLEAQTSRRGEDIIGNIEELSPRLTQFWARLWAEAERFLDYSRKDTAENVQLLLTPQLRSQPSWADLAMAWENLDVGLGQANQGLNQTRRFLEEAEFPDPVDANALVTESNAIQDDLEQLQSQLRDILAAHDEDNINWIDQNKGDVALHSAPLDIGQTLADNLFDRKDSVVLTSATLSTQKSFDFVRQRLGIPDDSDELLVGSPFDYKRAALLMIPDDMPQPSANNYLSSISRVLIDLGKSLNGRTMALFTSYASLRAVSQQIRDSLSSEGIQVLAQSVDGSPHQLMRRFTDNPKSVLLGTSSFWGGVDLPGSVLKALVLTRLPFQVPTDPIVKARSEQYPDPFNQYSVPQAVLRFQQGIGRLIRNKNDRGSIVLLDRRITRNAYGEAFLQSMPPCNLQPSSLATVGMMAAKWIGDGHGGVGR